MPRADEMPALVFDVWNAQRSIGPLLPARPADRIVAGLMAHLSTQ
jgi:hypothetical protein